MLFLSKAILSNDLVFVRAVAAVAIAFLTFVRGSSLMELRGCDVSVSLVGLEVSVWDEKTTKGSGVARQISIDISLCPLVGQVVLHFVQLQQAALAEQPCKGFFQLPGEAFPLAEGILHQCVSLCVAATGLDGVYGSALKGHSCRSGGVSALHAVGGSLAVCQARGGWKSLATMMEHYLSLEVLPSKAAFLLLGPLLPPPLLAAGKVEYGVA
jgi:hypothetical protein